MAKGHHCGHRRTRNYTCEYPRIFAKTFKALVELPLGEYNLSFNHFGEGHQKLKLRDNGEGIRYMTFNIHDKPHHIALKLDSRSASNKLYITCPYCRKSCQSLFAVKYAYACRACIGLHYPCQSERPQERLLRRIRKLRVALWGSDFIDVYNMFEDVSYWPKPKYMRWNTFEQKRSEILNLERQYWPMAIQGMKNIHGESFMASYPV